MLRASFRFHDDLGVFLAPYRRDKVFSYAFQAGQTVKHLIESFGAPHTDIGRVEVNGTPVRLDYQVQDGDRVEVFAPVPGSQSGGGSGPPSFLLDNHLGRLAVYLRMLGFDARYLREAEDAELAQLAQESNRVLLTRDRRLLMRKEVAQGYCLRSKDPVIQASEVLHRYDLAEAIDPFHRCLRCNAILQPVKKETVLHRLEPLTKKYFEEFRLCPDCDQVYWQGSHFNRMRSLIETIRDQAQA